MNLFYLEPDNVTGSTGTFSDEEARHIRQVLRKNDGDELTATDGEGNRFTGILRHQGKKGAMLEIHHSERQEAPFPELIIGVGLVKMRQRLEWMIEKLTELGVNKICLLHTSRTYRDKIRADRLKDVALSAMKQSLRCDLPEITEMSYSDFLDDFKIYPVWIAHEKADKEEGGPDLSSPCVIAIGPEGGFSDEEIELGLKFGAKLLSLGEQRLRTETAAIKCAAVFRF